MSAMKNEIQKRETAARAAIVKAFETENDEFGVTLFVTHHLKELDFNYWEKFLSVASPEPERVLGLLQLRSHWGGVEEIDTFDFTLPGNVTDYVISVKFDKFGEVSEIAMES